MGIGLGLGDAFFDHGCDLRRSIAMDAVADSGMDMQRAPGDLPMHEVGVSHRRHGVILAPEEIGGNADVFKLDPQIFCCDVDHGLPHDRVRLLVVMDADELVEEPLAQRLKLLDARDREEKFPALGERQSDDALEVTGMADARGGAEEKMANGEDGVARITRLHNG